MEIFKIRVTQDRDRFEIFVRRSNWYESIGLVSSPAEIGKVLGTFLDRFVPVSKSQPWRGHTDKRDGR